MEAWNYHGAAYRKQWSHTSSDVTDEQRSHHIKAHSEALPIRSSTDVFFVAGRMSRRRTVLGANHDVAHKAPTSTLRYDSGKWLSRRHIRYYLYIL